MSSSKRQGKKAPAAPARRGSSGPPASARLTIKPASRSRASVELPPRPRPSGARPLSEVVIEEDEILSDGFDAVFDGVRVRVTAVLERTCVYLGEEGERRLALKKDLWVEADKLPIRRRSFG